jgi:hypothetical protein
MLYKINVSGTTIKVQWHPPAQPNGIVKSYVIMYNDLTVRTPNNSTTFTLSGLVPFTRYTISVAAQNGAGVGNQSDNIIVQTKTRG